MLRPYGPLPGLEENGRPRVSRGLLSPGVLSWRIASGKGDAGAGHGGAVAKRPTVDDAAGEVEGDEGLAYAGSCTQERELASGDPGGPKPVDRGELPGHLVQGGKDAEGVVAGQQVDEVPGQMMAVLKALGDTRDNGLGVGPAAPDSMSSDRSW
jgi:hypothetical protein